MSKIISRTVELNCTRQKAFEMFTKNQLLEKWLCDRADVEVVVGGRYELFWNPPPENAGTVGCGITAMEKDKFLAFNWKGPNMFDSFMNRIDPLTHVVVFFSAKRDGACTDVHLIHSGWGTSQEWDEAREWFEKAWGGALQTLQKYLEAE